MPQIVSRKRQAPGASPVQVTSPNHNVLSTRSPADYVFKWDENAAQTEISRYPEPPQTFGPNLYHNMAPQPVRQSPSNQLTRRPANNHVVTRAPYGNGGGEGWTGAIDGLPQQSGDVAWMAPTDEERLDQEALRAMEAGKKARKQIPPFVQKLRR